MPSAQPKFYVIPGLRLELTSEELDSMVRDRASLEWLQERHPEWLEPTNVYGYGDGVVVDERGNNITCSLEIAAMFGEPVTPILSCYTGSPESCRLGLLLHRFGMDAYDACVGNESGAYLIVRETGPEFQTVDVVMPNLDVDHGNEAAWWGTYSNEQVCSLLADYLS